MKTIRLKAMSIKHFKGFENYSITFDGNSTDVYGDNDAGKTSIYDAFLWTMFHKDSKERTHFNWKPLDGDNQPIEGLQTSVKVVLEVNGTDMTFEKQKISKQTTNRKLEKKVYQDTTKYLIDGLETTTKTMYDSKVAEILDQVKFRNLTSITYFSEQLKASERRAALFEYFGTKTDEEIIMEHEELQPLLAIKGNLSVDDARTKVQQEAKRINETLRSIPIKIEGIQEAMPVLTDLNREVLTKERADLSKAVSKLQDQLVAIKNGGSIGEYRSQLRLKQTKLEEERIGYQNNQNAKSEGIQQGKSKLLAELNEQKNKKSEISYEKEKLERELNRENESLERLQKEDELLRQRFDEIVDAEFEPATFTSIPFDETSLSCAYCGTEYKEERKEELREHHEAEEKKRLEEFTKKENERLQTFENDQQTKIEQIRSEGKANVQEQDATIEKIQDIQNQLNDTSRFNLEELEKKITAMNEELSFAIEQINKIQGNVVPFEQTPKYEALSEEINVLTKSILGDEESLQEQISTKQSEIIEVQSQIQAIDEKLAMFTEYNRQQSVIESLNDQEREFSAKRGQILEDLALFEDFYIKKRDLLQDRINSHFSLVQWKLFDFHDTGNLDESVCEPMIDGVPFSDLNNGSRMQAGLDVANTLMKQEGYLVPIFIDNAEGMTGHKRKRVQVDTQVIALYVNELDKNLRVITHKEAISA